jgi:hypothetical protein
MDYFLLAQAEAQFVSLFVSATVAAVRGWSSAGAPKRSPLSI